MTEQERCPRCGSEDRPIRRYIDLGYQRVQCDSTWHMTEQEERVARFLEEAEILPLREQLRAAESRLARLQEERDELRDVLERAYRLMSNAEAKDQGKWGRQAMDVLRSAQARAALTHSTPPRSDGIAAFFQEALDETEGMELPHAYHMLRAKVLSRISALTPREEEPD